MPEPKGDAEADESCVFLRDAEDEDEHEKEEATTQKMQEEVKNDEKTSECEEGFQFQGRRGYLAKLQHHLF